MGWLYGWRDKKAEPEGQTGSSPQITSSLPWGQSFLENTKASPALRSRRQLLPSGIVQHRWLGLVPERTELSFQKPISEGLDR